MKSSLKSAHIAPKKANLIAMMVRGMSVPDAMEALRRTHKKGARMIEQLLRSAIANASHNFKQDPQTMIIRSIVVNQGTALRRGVPMARGRTRPIRKFMSHIDVELGFAEEEIEEIEAIEGIEEKKHVKTKKITAPLASSISSISSKSSIPSL